jgi:hypothetical protein
MELIPLTLALELATIAAVTGLKTDCESLVRWIERERPRMSHTRCTSLLMVAERRVASGRRMIAAITLLTAQLRGTETQLRLFAGG